MAASPPASSENPDARLLGSEEPPACEIFDGGRRLPVLLVCDHASRRFPRALGTLGIPDAATWRHIAWDIGAGELMRALALRLGVRGVLSNYSRLVIDCNRRLNDPTSIVTESDGQVIPGNLALTAAERARRARECFAPYHAAVDEVLEELAAASQAPAVIGIHSFTPRLNGSVRPWHCGVLWDRDPRIALPLLAALRSEAGLVVGDNEPYSGRHPADFTIDVHAEARGWACACIEVRQDLIADPDGVARWAERLAAALGPILGTPELYRAVPHPS